MMKQVLAVISILNLLVFSSVAGAQTDSGYEELATIADTGIADGALDSSVDAAVQLVTDAGCTDTDYIGRCVGDELHYCDNGQDSVLLCTNPASYPRGGPTATCGLLDCTEPGTCQGYWCVARSGASCETLHCDFSQQMACVEGICQVSEPCGPEATGAPYTEHCDGASWTYCANGLVGSYDCSFAGTAPYACQDADLSLAPCIGLAGAECDILAGRLCIEGLPCVQGHCQGTEDAGVAAEDAAIDAGSEEAGPVADAAHEIKEEPGCSCSTQTSSSQNALIVFALMMIFVLRRQRSSLV